ncbi:toprim domain-containing protein [Mucilaginibacter sp. AW1-7]|jgi:DNA primase|uniref:toprim domain-containing protein n=1 Tax=Mucilaginibacter sp. AW1-7 TaxID=3349874 RepID=UPI003F73D94A
MDNLLEVKGLKEQVSIVDLLARLGFHPLRRSGKEDIYLSMLRDSDTKPSFAVNDELGVWYDHGLGKGGNVIDFGLLYWAGSTFSDVIGKIKSTCNLPILRVSPDLNRINTRRHALKVPHYRVESVKELGNNPAISRYLQSRGIFKAADGHLKEVYYFVEDEKKTKKYFFAAGWQNELGGWEVRNKYFKGCLGHKAISLIQGDTDRLHVFEGYFNYLSWKTDNPLINNTVLVMNTTVLLQAAIKNAAAFKDVSIYFDHDKTGQDAAAEFIRSLPLAVDRSEIYKGYNDYNDYLIAVPTRSSERSFFR